MAMEDLESTKLWVLLMYRNHCTHYVRDKGRQQNSPQLDDKNMMENIGDLFVKYMQQVMKGHLYRLYQITM